MTSTTKTMGRPKDVNYPGACSACKQQRKKCRDDCLLAPYFPANMKQQFDAVRTVFGVTRVTNMIKNARVEDRRRLVDSLVWEACCRLRDPVHGSYGEYQRLADEVQTYRQLQQQPPHLDPLASVPGIGFEEFYTAWTKG